MPQIIYVNPDLASQISLTADSLLSFTTKPYYSLLVLNIKGSAAFSHNEYDTAIGYYLEALEIVDREEGIIYKAQLYNNLASAYQSSGDLESCISYYKKALVSFEEKRDTLMMAHMNNNLAIQYMNLKEFDESDNYFLKSKSFYNHLNLALYQGITALNYGNLKVETKSFKEAKSLFKEALTLVDIQSNKLVNAAANGGLAVVLLELGKLNDAKHYAQLSLQQSREINHLEQEKVSLEALADIHERQGQFAKAMTFQKSLNSVNDSLYKQQQDQKLSDALKKYETAEQEKEIALLNSENEIASLRASNFRRAFVFSLIGIGLVLGLVYYLTKLNRTIRQKNEIISKTLGEKEILLREIHHRVKNNLQIISSLLDLQSNRTDDNLAKSALKTGRNRVQSMALIHQNLYQDEQLTGINVKDYLTKLTTNLFHTYNIKGNKVKLHLNVENIILDVDTMIPLGLIINELVTNILKHAFPNQDDGNIYVELKTIHNDLYLKIDDDGVGMPLLNAKESSSFGYQLIHSLSDQISSDLNIESSEGTSVSLRIKEYKQIA